MYASVAYKGLIDSKGWSRKEKRGEGRNKRGYRGLYDRKNDRGNERESYLDFGILEIESIFRIEYVRWRAKVER